MTEEKRIMSTYLGEMKPAKKWLEISNAKSGECRGYRGENRDIKREMNDDFNLSSPIELIGCHQIQILSSLFTMSWIANV